MSESCVNPFSDFIIKEAIAFEPGKVYMLNITADNNFIKNSYAREQVISFAQSLKRALNLII